MNFATAVQGTPVAVGARAARAQRGAVRVQARCVRGAARVQQCIYYGAAALAGQVGANVHAWRCSCLTVFVHVTRAAVQLVQGHHQV